MDQQQICVTFNRSTYREANKHDDGLCSSRIRNQGILFILDRYHTRLCRHAVADGSPPLGLQRDIKSVTTRTSNKTVTFTRPFLLKGIDRTLEAGDYRVVTDEELIEGLSFPVYRRVATMIFVPAPSYNASSVEMVTVDPQDLQAAQDRDVNHGA